MHWLSLLLSPLRLVVQRVRSWPYLGRGSFAFALLIMLLLVTQGHHLDHPPEIAGYEVQDGQLIAQQGIQPAGQLLKIVSFLLPYLDLWMLVGGGVYVFVLLRQWGNASKLVFPTWVAALSVAAWAIVKDIALQLGHLQISALGEPPAMEAYWLKLGMVLVAALCLPLMLRYYVKSGALERYTLRTFLAPLIFCFAAFCSLWVIMDLLDNLKDFQEASVPLGRVVMLYVGMLPFIFVSVMPASLLLAVLYTLTKMSRSNEIVAMLTAGRSVRQILQPLFVVTVFVSIISLAANYHWAPRAENNRKAVVRAMSARQKDSIMNAAVLYRDPQSGRVWYLGTVPASLGGERLRGVQVREVDAAGRTSRVIYADSALWLADGRWRFYNGQEALYKDGQPAGMKPFPQVSKGVRMLEVKTYSETPWKMVSHDLKPDYMGVPQLVSYLKAHPKDTGERMAPFETHFFHRFALPWQCLALALVAAPLGIAYSRRGSVGGIAGSIFIFFGILFLNNLCLNLGKGGHVPAWLSPWLPTFGFGLLGLILLHYRSQNKDLPRFSPSFLFARKAQVRRPRNAQSAS